MALSIAAQFSIGTNSMVGHSTTRAPSSVSRSVRSPVDPAARVVSIVLPSSATLTDLRENGSGTACDQLFPEFETQFTRRRRSAGIACYFICNDNCTCQICNQAPKRNAAIHQFSVAGNGDLAAALEYREQSAFGRDGQPCWQMIQCCELIHYRLIPGSTGNAKSALTHRRQHQRFIDDL